MRIRPVERNGRWHVPDASEFVFDCHWKDGIFVVPETIEGEVSYPDYATALLDAHFLELTIIDALRIKYRS